TACDGKPQPQPQPPAQPQPQPPAQPQPQPPAQPQPVRPQPTATRVPLLTPDHPLYRRLEGPDASDACAADSQCSRAGCRRDLCTAQRELMTTCEVIEKPAGWPADAACGCVEGRCRWWSTAPLPSGQPAPEDSTQCGDRRCAPPERCVAYYGIAGPSGPELRECVIPCSRGAANHGCPTGTKCVTIADGPGDVCR
ncbi:MAG: hypothetical protein KC636_36505, partial [Myxococcales bacterium]|nr:hypothetical protein [Myxococcales bacterium]